MINAKNPFEQDAMHCGVNVEVYHTNNGIFTCHQFCVACSLMQIGHQISGVGTNHQNGVAEHAAKTIQDMNQSMMLCLLVHWTDKMMFVYGHLLWITLYSFTTIHHSMMADWHQRRSLWE